MNTRLPLPSALAALLLALGPTLAGCPFLTTDDDDAAAPRETVESVCEAVLDCGGWGWIDVEECVEGFLDNPEFNTECEEPDDYLACMPDCMELDCEGFSTCEGDCWAGACE